jgi:hypothetical protein
MSLRYGQMKREIIFVTGARRTGLMSDFVWSIFIAIGIVVMALGIVAWITLRRIREEEARRQ